MLEGLTVLLLEINRRHKSRGIGTRVTEISDGDQVTGRLGNWAIWQLGNLALGNQIRSFPNRQVA